MRRYLNHAKKIRDDRTNETFSDQMEFVVAKYSSGHVFAVFIIDTFVGKLDADSKCIKG